MQIRYLRIRAIPFAAPEMIHSDVSLYETGWFEASSTRSSIMPLAA
jgi:hypothetical protein